MMNFLVVFLSGILLQSEVVNSLEPQYFERTIGHIYKDLIDSLAVLEGTINEYSVSNDEKIEIIRELHDEGFITFDKKVKFSKFFSKMPEVKGTGKNNREELKLSLISRLKKFKKVYSELIEKYLNSTTVEFRKEIITSKESGEITSSQALQLEQFLIEIGSTNIINIKAFQPELREVYSQKSNPKSEL